MTKNPIGVLGKVEALITMPSKSLIILLQNMCYRPCATHCNTQNVGHLKLPYTSFVHKNLQQQKERG